MTTADQARQLTPCARRPACRTGSAGARSWTEIEIAVRPGTLHRPARPERRRQDHAVLAGHPALRRPVGPRSGSSAATSAPEPAAGAGADRRGVPAARARPRPGGPAEPALPRGAARHARAPSPGPRIAAELERVGLAKEADRKIRGFSGGETRRVEIARALLHEPRLLLCDEATVGLDIRSRAAILADVRGLVRDRGLAVLWATHLIDEVEAGRPDHHPAPRPRPAAGAGARRLIGHLRSRRRRPAGRLPPADGGGMTRSTPTGPSSPRRRLALPAGHPVARGAALRAAAHPLRLGSGAAAGLAVHLRRRLPLGARRLDHPALRDLHPLRRVHRPRADRDDPAVQRDAELAVDGL